MLEIRPGKGRGATRRVRVDRDLSFSFLKQEGGLMLAMNNGVLVASSGAHFCLEISWSEL